MAPSYNSILPVPLEQDDDYIAITNFYYTQFIGEKFGVWAGRSDTHHSANLGEFAGLSSEVGNTQFMNFALTGIPVMPFDPALRHFAWSRGVCPPNKGLGLRGDGHGFARILADHRV